MTTMDDDAVFADLGLSEVSGDPNDTPDGVYKAVVDNVKIFTHNGKEAGKDRFLIITYKIMDDTVSVMVGGQQRNVVVKDNTIDEWKSANKGDTSKQKSFLKQRLLSLGVDEADINSGKINFRALFGTPVNITVKNKDGFTNVNKVVKVNDAGWSSSANSQPAATNNSGGNSQPVANGGLDF